MSFVIHFFLLRNKTVSTFFFLTAKTTKTNFLYFRFIRFFITQRKSPIKIRFFYLFKQKKEDLNVQRLVKIFLIMSSFYVHHLSPLEEKWRGLWKSSLFFSNVYLRYIQKKSLNTLYYFTCNRWCMFSKVKTNRWSVLLDLLLEAKLNLNPWSANFAKWSNTLKQFVGKLPTNCLSVFDHFVRLALKGLRKTPERFKKAELQQYISISNFGPFVQLLLYFQSRSGVLFCENNRK